MTNRALIVAIIIVSIAWVGVIGYVVGNTNKQSSAPIPKPSSSGAIQQPPAKAPKVFEKDTQGLFPDFSPKYVESCTLKFPLEAFNRVEGEVIVKKINPGGVVAPANKAWVYALVLDHYGNTVLRNAPNSNRQNDFPWRFSFVASSTGEHGLVAYTGVQLMDGLYVAHLKVTVYEK